MACASSRKPSRKVSGSFRLADFPECRRPSVLESEDSIGELLLPQRLDSWTCRSSTSPPGREPLPAVPSMSSVLSCLFDFMDRSASLKQYLCRVMCHICAGSYLQSEPLRPTHVVSLSRLIAASPAVKSWWVTFRLLTTIPLLFRLAQ